MPLDPNQVIVGAPSAKRYVGLLRNTGESPMLVQLIPISGRDDGSGSPSFCYLERWDSASRSWLYLPPALIESTDSFQIKTFTLKPREAIAMCTSVLPKEAGQSCECSVQAAAPGQRLGVAIGAVADIYGGSRKRHFLVTSDRSARGERLGIFMHGNGPNVLYPAVHELYALGKPAEPALLRFVAGIKDAGRIDRENVLYTLLLMHHGNAMDVVEILTKERNASGNDSARARLQAAAKDAAKWCDARIKVKCEDIQK